MNKVSKVEVTNVEIKVGENNFKLTITEAMELKKILNDTFGVGYRDTHIPVPYVIPEPTYIERLPYRRWNDWQITWTGNVCESDDTQTAGTLCLSNSGGGGST